MTEVAALRKNARQGVAYVADLLDRSPASVRAQAKRQRISLRRRGSRRGVCLGQPRGESWTVDAKARELRSLVITGALDMGRAEREIVEDLEGRSAPLCPQCAQRPQRNPRTGLCQVCHNRRLAEKARDATAELESKRAFDNARWVHKRVRDRGTSSQTETD
jgi:hypothetical protein